MPADILVAYLTPPTHTHTSQSGSKGKVLPVQKPADSTGLAHCVGAEEGNLQGRGGGGETQSSDSTEPSPLKYTRSPDLPVQSQAGGDVHLPQ